MLKLLIVDDQKKDLEGICEILNWSSLGVELAGTATNGQEGLRKAAELKPDIILTDVVMPIMDGLALMEETKNVLPQIKFIITSCHDDFNYVRRALDIGAVGYVLKPIIASDLHKVMVKAVEICNNERQKALNTEFLEKRLNQNIPAMRENFLRNIANGVYKEEGAIWDDITFLGLAISRESMFCILYLEIDDYAAFTAEYSTKEKHMLLVTMKAIIEEHISDKRMGFFIPIDESHMAILITDEKQESESLQNKGLVDLASGLLNDLRLQLGISITIGVGPFVKNLLEAEHCFRQAKDAIKLKFQLGKGQIIMSGDQLSPGGYVKYNGDNLLKEVKSFLFSDNMDETDKFVDRVIGGSGHGIHEAYTQFICISVINYAQLVLMEMNENLKSVFSDENKLYEKLFKIESIVDIREWMKSILTPIKNFIRNKTQLRNSRVVEKIEQIMLSRYSSDISINDIAHEIYLSPSYASYIFKQETGKSFTEFLTKVRIDKSLELLANPQLKIYEVAEMVGYNNKSYFCAIFKERTGLTPKEYREKLW